LKQVIPRETSPRSGPVADVSSTSTLPRSVAGADRTAPPDVVGPAPSHVCHVAHEAVDEHPGIEADRVPAGSDEPPEDALLGRRLVDVERLRIVALGEVDDLLARHRPLAELVALADREVLEVLRHSLGRSLRTP